MEQWWALVGNKSAYKQLKEKYSLDKPKRTNVKKLNYKNQILEHIINELMLKHPNIRVDIEQIIQKEKAKKEKHVNETPFITRLPSRNKAED